MGVLVLKEITLLHTMKIMVYKKLLNNILQIIFKFVFKLRDADIYDCKFSMIVMYIV